MVGQMENTTGEPEWMHSSPYDDNADDVVDDDDVIAYTATCEPSRMLHALLDDDDDFEDDVVPLKAIGKPAWMPPPARAACEPSRMSADLKMYRPTEDTKKDAASACEPSGMSCFGGMSRMPSDLEMNTEDNVDNTAPSTRRNMVASARDRFLGILYAHVKLIFGILGIILYLVDVGSDIAAGVSYFQQGHQGLGSLTIGIVLLSAISWAAISWTWWWYYWPNDHKTRWDYYVDKEEEYPTYRRKRMLLSILLLDPLIR